MLNLKALTITATLGLGTLFAPAPAEAFGFGQLIQGVGQAAGVGQITNVVGGAIHAQEVQRTNQMLNDKAVAAQLEQNKIDAQNAATEAAIQAEVERRLAAAQAAQPAPQAAPAASSNSQDAGVTLGQMKELTTKLDAAMNEGMGGMWDVMKENNLKERCEFAANPQGCVELNRQQAAQWGM